MLNDILQANRGTRIVQGRYGHVAYWEHDVIVGSSVAAYGEWFESEVDVFRMYCRSGDTVIDVGTNIGTHTLALAAIVGSGGRVIAIEPQRPMFMLMCANAVMNGYLQVEPYRAGAGSEWSNLQCLVPDYLRKSSFGGYSLEAVAATPMSNGRLETVQVFPIDEMDFGSPRLIKIDVEGAEVDVIEGARRLIQRARPVLYVENDRVDRSRELIARIRSLGYRLYWHLPRFFNPANHARNTEQIPYHVVGMFRGPDGGLSVNGVSLNMLCIPDEAACALPQDVTEVGDDGEHPCHEKDRRRLAPGLEILN